MATKQEIVETIQRANDQIQQTYANMSEEEAQTRVGDGGWTAKEVLAHMAGRQPAYQRLIELAESSKQADNSRIDPDAWNESLVSPRRDQPLARVLDEFLAVHQEVITQVEGMSDDMLALKVSLPQVEMTLGELLRLAAGTHTLNHLEEVRQALV